MARLRIAFGALVAIVCLVGLARHLESISSPKSPNLLLIGIDTLRADRLGCYGYGRPTSPHIDALARESVLFERAISQAPWTLPAFASIFTGLLPSTHGGGRGKGWQCDRLTAEHATLATLLRARGYRTASFVTNGWVSRDAGMTAGIDPADTNLWVESEGTQNIAIGWLQAHGARPFFLFVHLVDPHAPYKPPAEDLAALGIEVDAEAAERINAVASTRRPYEDLRPTDRAVLSDLYDADVHRADRRVGRLVAELRRLGLLDRTIVVVVSDHGEELLERGHMGHGHTLYDELLHVPMLVRFPEGRWAQRVSQQVRTMDLMPTLLEALSLPVPAGLDGQSLLPLVRKDPGATAPGPAPAEFLWQGHELKAIRHRDAKMVLTPSTGELHWFDLGSDPGETAPIRSVSGKGAALQQDVERVFSTRLDGILVSAFGDGADHDVRLVLTTDTAFEEPSLIGRERNERLHVSADRRRLKVRFHLQASSFPPAWVDVDSLRVRTAGNLPVRITGRMDGRLLDASNLRLGAQRRRPRGPLPWTVKPDDPQVIVPGGYVPEPDEAAIIFVTARGTIRAAEQAPLSPRTTESLRALGYIH